MKTTCVVMVSLLLGGTTAWAQRGAPMPEPRIMQFEARPASIKPGEAAILSWHVENPTDISISPGVGVVTPRGTQMVKPSATTTYTISVGRQGQATITKSLIVIVAGTNPVAPAVDQPLAKKAVPRTVDGHPDFTGVYDFRAPASAGGGRGARGAPPAAAAAGSLPSAPTLKAGMDSYRVVPGPYDVGGKCSPGIPPGSFGSPYQFQIVQNKDTVLIFYEYPGTFRVIPLDEPHSVDPDPAWMGESVGRWEGDTLVVDTIGYNDKTTVGGGRGGYRHTDALHTVERFRRTEDALELEVTLEDPNVFTGPWRETRTFKYLPELKKIGEFVCENNRDYRSLFGPDVAAPQQQGR
jgi:hypothetical protein